MIAGNVGTIHKGTKKQIYRNKTGVGNTLLRKKTKPSCPVERVRRYEMAFYETLEHVSKQLYSFYKIVQIL